VFQRLVSKLVPSNSSLNFNCQLPSLPPNGVGAGVEVAVGVAVAVAVAVGHGLRSRSERKVRQNDSLEMKPIPKKIATLE